jgi:peptide/nickel transport system substrate-binding protein
MRIEKPTKSRLAMTIAMLGVATALTLPQAARAETVLRTA